MTHSSIEKSLSWGPRKPGVTGLLESADSRTLLEYYALNTAGLLAARRTAENPFLTCVFPQALADDLILNCVLAIGAAHRAYEDANPAYEVLHAKHYVLAVRQLQRDLTTAINGDTSDNPRLLLAALLLATLEVRVAFSCCVSGSKTDTSTGHVW